MIKKLIAYWNKIVLLEEPEKEILKTKSELAQEYIDSTYNRLYGNPLRCKLKGILTKPYGTTQPTEGIFW